MQADPLALCSLNRQAICRRMSETSLHAMLRRPRPFGIDVDLSLEKESALVAALYGRPASRLIYEGANQLERLLRIVKWQPFSFSEAEELWYFHQSFDGGIH